MLSWGKKKGIAAAILGMMAVSLFSMPVLGASRTTELAGVSTKTDETKKEAASFEDYLIDNLEQRSAEIDVSAYGLTRNNVYQTFLSVIYKHPELYYVNSRLRYVYHADTEQVMSIQITYHEYDEQAIEAEVEKILGLIEEDMTDLEKILTVHDYLCMDVEYAYDAYLSGVLTDDVHTLKGALIDKVAVCDGYSSAFQYIMQRLDIPCNLVVGKANGGDHAWNQVKLYGDWYMLDLIWDDPAWDNYGSVNHDRFLVDESCLEGYEWDRFAYEPCTDTMFKDAFWRTVKTQIVRHEDDWYYVSQDGNLKKHNFSKDGILENGETIIQIGGTWFVFDDPTYYYDENFIRLDKKDDRLYYSQPGAIYSCKFDGSEKHQVLTVDAAQGFVFGMKVEDNILHYQIAQEPYREYRIDQSVEIMPYKDFETAEIWLSANSFDYTGERQFPDVLVIVDGTILEEGRDYSITYDYPESGVGTATVKVTGKNFYLGEKTASYKIKEAVKTPGSQETEIPDESETESAPKETEPEINLPIETEPQQEGTMPAETKKPEKVKVVSSKSTKKRKIQLTWKKQDCTGYRIQFSLKSNFRKIVKTVIIRSPKKVKKTISGFSSGKKYYIRVQAYKTANGEKYYGAFSKKRKVLVK